MPGHKSFDCDSRRDCMRCGESECQGDMQCRDIANRRKSEFLVGQARANVNQFNAKSFFYGSGSKSDESSNECYGSE